MFNLTKVSVQPDGPPCTVNWCIDLGILGSLGWIPVYSYPYRDWKSCHTKRLALSAVTVSYFPKFTVLLINYMLGKRE